MSAEIIAFAGPCLAAPGAGGGDLGRERWAGITFWPPARRGDILRALCREPRVLVLLDGFFYDVPSVTHKELLYALDSGVRVIGASSMGALRAAELWRHGMEGVGKVFEWFRDGWLEGDDEVTILHAPEAFGWRPLTLALVEVRHVLEAMAREQELPEGGGEAVIEALVALPFNERFPATVDRLARRHLGETVARDLARRLSEESIKRSDAERALALAVGPSGGGPTALDHGHPSRQPLTLYCGYFREWSLGPGGGEELTPEDVGVMGSPRARGAGGAIDAASFWSIWQRVQVFHPRAADFVRSRRQRFLLASAALRAGLEPSRSELGKYRDRLRAWVHEHHQGPLLPVAELDDEADEQSRAELAWATWGDWRPVCRLLGPPLGLGAGIGVDELLARLRRQGDLVPPWGIVRSFVFSSWLEPARRLAREALQIHRAFEVWSKGAWVQEGALREIAARLWRCPASEVSRQAARRGLFPSDAYRTGFREALQAIAAAERLPRPLNAYPERREALRATPLEHAFGRSPWEEDERRGSGRGRELFAGAAAEGLAQTPEDQE